MHQSLHTSVPIYVNIYIYILYIILYIILSLPHLSSSFSSGGSATAVDLDLLVPISFLNKYNEAMGWLHVVLHMYV